MAKKPMTPEEKKAWGAKMKAAREAKKKQEVEQSKQEAAVANEDVAALLKRIEELEKRQAQGQGQFFGPQVTSKGVVGVFRPYSLSRQDYPDPTERLTSEPKLEEKGFKHNFFLEYTFKPQRHETTDGNPAESPMFRLKLWRRAEDPKTGELTNKTFLVQKATFFEDPDSALWVASEHGLTVPDELSKDFLDEMRYLRFRDWLFQIFWPAPTKTPDYIREEVFDNALRPVKILETSSSEPVDIPFDRL